MKISKEEFEQTFQETLDTVLTHLAEHPEVAPERFYSLACMLENLAFFSPVLYEAILNTKKD
jgi:predicted component of type VI protein secretion system